MKNKTGFKTLNVVNDDPRVAECFKDEDGIWLWLNAGWTADPLSAHDIHEDTAGAVLSQYRGIVACDCDGCKLALAKAAAKATTGTVGL